MTVIAPVAVMLEPETSAIVVGVIELAATDRPTATEALEPPPNLPDSPSAPAIASIDEVSAALTVTLLAGAVPIGGAGGATLTTLPVM